MTPGAYKILCPALAAVFMVGIAIESATRPRPMDAEPYHQRVRKLSENIPVSFGSWVGKDMEVYQSATKLLNPNFILQRVYKDEKRNLAATFLIVQCKDARDMGGHYPLNCYPTQGYELIDNAKNKWSLGDGSVIEGKTYRFIHKRDSVDEIIIVNSIMIVPDEGFVDTIEKVRDAAASLSHRFFGAAQIQVVMSDQIMPEERAMITTEILQANKFIIDALRYSKPNGGSK